jgi:hypothetical protein
VTRRGHIQNGVGVTGHGGDNMINMEVPVIVYTSAI